MDSRALELLELPAILERLGFESIWTGEHVLSKWPGESIAFDCWALSSGLAPLVPRVGIGLIVLNSTFHNPAMIAKKAATLDEVSGGRFILGLGAGWNEPEYRAFGFPFDHRVSRFEEALKIINPLLKEGKVDFQGTYSSANDGELRPRGPRPVPHRPSGARRERGRRDGRR